MSITDVFEATGISRSQISRIENGMVDPRMSTVTELLTCYGASLAYLESSPPAVVSLRDIKRRARRGSERLAAVGLGRSDPEERLARRGRRGPDTWAESEALPTRS